MSLREITLEIADDESLNLHTTETDPLKVMFTFVCGLNFVAKELNMSCEQTLEFTKDVMAAMHCIEVMDESIKR